jgi:hypothetical protein
MMGKEPQVEILGSVTLGGVATPPTYRSAGRLGVASAKALAVEMCESCGALVADQGVHTAWHMGGGR